MLMHVANQFVYMFILSLHVEGYREFVYSCLYVGSILRKLCRVHSQTRPLYKQKDTC